MASSKHRSRSVSPDPFADPYDPFIPPLESHEMSNMDKQSADAQNIQDRAGAASPDISPPMSPPAGYPFGRGNDGSSDYTPVQGAERPAATLRSGPVSLRSGAASLYSLNSLNHYKTVDHHTQQLVDKRAGELAEWHIHWVTPAMIAALFVAGVIAAVGHHLFYAHLDGKPAADQLKMIRYGTALAFFVKSTLVGTVIMCYRQRIWHTFRTRPLTINAIDGLFSATEDPTQFWNWEMIRNGKLATFMAACSWLIPIASVLSPSSLTSEMTMSHNLTHCPSVASLNFTHEALFDFRKETEFAGSSLPYYNTTDAKGEQEGYFDYYDQPSKLARRLVVMSMYGQKPVTNDAASNSSCGPGWNCTYSINFEAPGYKCDEFASESNPNAGSAPFNLSVLAPQGENIYYANVDLDDYQSPQIATGSNGQPIQGPPYPTSLGVFESEPVLWIGHAVKTTTLYDKNSPYAGWKYVHKPYIYKCVMQNTNYTFEMRYNDTTQSHDLKQRDFLSPVIDTTVTVNPENSSDTVASPSSNFVSPRDDVPKYKRTASYHTMGALLRDFLRGQITYNYNSSLFVTKSDISETRLMDSQTSYPLVNLKDEIQSVFQDMLISLLSNPHLVVAHTQNVPCAKTRMENVFSYHREGLWIGYALAVAFTLVFIFVGSWAIHQNGVASDTLFSRILVTTRNPTLDRLSVGACLGGDPFPKELIKTKLRFGVLLEDDHREGPLGKVEHCCFGAAGETKEIVKYGTYAGLKRWRRGTDEAGNESEKRALLEEDAQEDCFKDTDE